MALSQEVTSQVNSIEEPASQTVLTTRPHFKALDGLRGVAALAVVTFHFMEMAVFDYTKLFIGHGWLAVDFFFCLSGFVIGYAYDDRVHTMGLWKFFQARLIRLHPLVLLGSVLGLFTLFADPFRSGPLAYSPGKIAIIFLASIFLIPYPVMQERGFNLFSLNAPAWSLFWEYIANIVYALIFSRLSRIWLIIATVLAAIHLCVAGHHAGELYGGWSGPSFWDGGTRMTYSFLAGLLVYRSKWIIRSKLGFAALSVLLLLALLMPYADGGWKREAAVIILYFPLLIALGAGAQLTPRSEKICTFAGNMSYPLYMTHYSVIWVFGNYYTTYKPDRFHFTLVVTSGVLVMVGVAYLVMIFYDIPIRGFLLSRTRNSRLAAS